MLKVVVAEDELPLLRGLSCLIERMKPEFSVVYQAKNGKEALEYFAQHEADVLFTDINMPVVSGIQLMEQVKQMNPRIMMVVISGYGDFEYARQAMAFGAKGYLLKPLNRDELTSLLERLLKESEKISYSYKRSALIEYLFSANAQALNVCDWKPMTLLYICMGAYQLMQTEAELPKPGALSDEGMWQTISGHWGYTDFWLFFGKHPNEAVWIFETDPPLSLNDLRQILHSRFQEYIPVTAAYASQVPVQEILTKMDELSQWVMKGVVFGESRLLKSEPVVKEYTLSIAEKSALRVSIQKQKWDEFSIQVQRVIQSLCDEHITQQQMEHFLAWVLEMIEQETGCSTNKENRLTVHELISGSDDQKTLLQAFFKYCKDVSQNVAFDIGDKQSLMRSMEEYILDHIAQPLSMKELSAKFGLVAPYLSKLFKAYKGMSPAQYIQMVRIENAKRMLRENPAMLSKEISDALGYSNPLYFSKTFYKHVGMYPSEYRMKYKRETAKSVFES